VYVFSLPTPLLELNRLLSLSHSVGSLLKVKIKEAKIWEKTVTGHIPVKITILAVHSDIQKISFCSKVSLLYSQEMINSMSTNRICFLTLAATFSRFYSWCCHLSSREDPTDDSRVFAEYAQSNN
jgi:hypothetical protein